MIRDRLEFLAGLPEHGKVVEVKIFGKRTVVVCDPTLLREVLKKDHVYDKGGPVFDRIRLVMGYGLATATFDTHRGQRKTVAPFFRNCSRFADTMAEEWSAAAESWRHLPEVDQKAEFKAVSSRILSRCMFFNGVTQEQIGQIIEHTTYCFDKVATYLVTPAFYSRLPTAGNRRFREHLNAMYSLIHDLIESRRRNISDEPDLLDALIAAGGTEKEIANNVITFYSAGTSTVASAITTLLVHLAMHQEYLAKVQAEIDSFLNCEGGASARGASTPILQRAVKETLRVTPPVYSLTRTVVPDEGAVLGGYHLPSGRAVIVSPYVVQCAPSLTCPVDFDPDRWEDVEMFPFGGGARKCIGDVFGTMSVTSAAIEILSRFCPVSKGASGRSPWKATASLSARPGVLALIPR
ncbi:cytochrome P450 [Nocardia brasiliensis]|uniref:cytochrome P450 n=1 Tax=Nocardia brasiliensis TaxID=37326 RepID=UPI0032AF914B